MTETETQTLSFGLSRALPEDVSVAWGARALPRDARYKRNPRTGRDRIEEPAGFDLLMDRQSWIGNESERKAFRPLINKAIPKAQTRYRALLREGKLIGSDDGLYTLYRDDHMQIDASANASYGHIYLAAWSRRSHNAKAK